MATVQAPTSNNETTPSPASNVVSIPEAQLLEFSFHEKCKDSVDYSGFAPVCLGKFSLFKSGLNKVKDHMDVREFEKRIRFDVKCPLLKLPQLPCVLTEGQKYVQLEKRVSILPILLAAADSFRKLGAPAVDDAKVSQHARTLADFDIVTERNSLNLMARQDSLWTIGVQRIGKSLFLQRYPERKNSVNLGDIGYVFERACTAGGDANTSYVGLFSSRLGPFNILKTGELDAEDGRTGALLEIKCKNKPQKLWDASTRKSLWVQSRLAGIETIVFGCKEAADKPRKHLIRSIESVPVADLVKSEVPHRVFSQLVAFFQFLTEHVKEGTVYQLRRRKVQDKGTHIELAEAAAEAFVTVQLLKLVFGAHLG